MRDCLGGLAWCVLAAGTLSAQAPTVDTLKQVLNQRLQALRPQGYTERNVLFQEVRPGRPNGDYPFQVTALIRDYEPGYPANHYYGQTCVGRMDKSVFRLSKNEFNEWKVEGAMTVSSDARQCKPNPAAGVSSIPLASLQGSAAPAGSPAPAPAPAAPATGQAPGLAQGEWACYGTGGRLLIGLGFRVLPGGAYTDLDRKLRGSYSIQAGTIAFRGGSLDGQTGRNFRGNRFDLSGTVSCEPFR